MRLRLIHRELSDHGAAVRDFVREMQTSSSVEIESVNPDSAEGAELCRLYGVMQYPAIIVTSDEGVLSFMSQGLPMPLVREVQYYARQ